MYKSTTTHSKDPFDGTAAQAVASFINGAAPDENGRCMAAALFTLSMWQIAPQPFTATVPSVLLVNAGDAQCDPLDVFAEEFVFNLGWLEQSLRDGSNVTNPHIPGDAHKAMRAAVWGAGQITPDHVYTEICRNQFHNYRARDYGDGPGYRYTRAWTEQYGWLSNDDRLILRLDQDDDRKALRHDLLTGSKKLHDAKGIGWELKQVSKELALSGSLHSGEWDEAIVTKMITGGWPVLFIPHSVTVPLRTEHKTNLHLARMKVAGSAWWKPVTAPDALPDDPWLQHHFHHLRMRLAHMPANYGFAIQRIIRELGVVCMRLAHVICSDTNDGQVTTIIGQDLYRMTLRAIVIGVAALAYQGWGFTTNCGRAEVVALLHHLRTHGPSSRRDLQRKFPAMDSQHRDELLDRLEDERLVECNGRHVSAVPLSNFIESLQGRTEFPQTGALSNLLLGHKASMAGPLPGVEVQ